MNFNKYICIIILITIIVSNIKGQETKSQIDTINDTHIKALNGIEIEIEGPYLEGFSSGSTMSPISLSYVREFKIIKTATLLLKGGGVVLPMSMKNRHVVQPIYKPLIGNELNYLNFGLNFVIEPRWYWKISKKTLSGKIKQNSGWYLSFPFESTIPIDFAISAYKENYDFNNFHDLVWVKDYLRVYYNFGPALGYKYTPSNHWYIDFMIQVMAKDYYIKNYQNSHFGTTEINPQLKIKAAYVFN